MKIFAPILAATICIAAVPAFAGSLSGSDEGIRLAGARFCVGPGCDRHGWRYRDRDSWRYRYHHGYGYGCRDVTIRRDDGSVTHIHRCD